MVQQTKAEERLNHLNYFQELVGWVGNATADFTVLGGDFNTDPRDAESSYSDLKSLMVSSIEEFFLDMKAWLMPARATYGNPRNTYSSMYSPVLYDYVWHKAAGNMCQLARFI